MRATLLDPVRVGGALVMAGLVLLAWPTELWLGALGVELFAAGFWWWARAADDAPRAVRQWGWLRRAAAAMWLAAAVHQVLPAEIRTEVEGLWPVLQSIAVAWAGLELIGALPLARPFADLPGPGLSERAWVPVLLPAAGFLLLWRHAPSWTQVPVVRDGAIALLVITAALAVLRAFVRLRWTASLRWLAVADAALAAALVATAAVDSASCLVLWAGAAGSHAFLLATELRGALPRRGPIRSALWRVTAWVAVAALSWPMLVTVGFADGVARWPWLIGAAIPVTMAAWITVARLHEAPERRALARPDPALTLSALLAPAALAAAPLALATLWWGGLQPPFHVAAIAAVPALLGGIAGLGPQRVRQLSGATAARLAAAGQRTRGVSGGLWRVVVRWERAAVGLVMQAVRGLLAPLRDLHTGDAQEYLLVVVGIAVLAAVMPLLR
jgi:hypothetical protein